jgi:hypothetical protein
MSIQRIHSSSSNFDLISVIDKAHKKKIVKKMKVMKKNFLMMLKWRVIVWFRDSNWCQSKNSRIFELNTIDNIGIGTRNNINVQNIGVDTNSNTSNSLYHNVLLKCLKNIEEDENNDVDFSLHDTQTNYLF